MIDHDPRCEFIPRADMPTRAAEIRVPSTYGEVRAMQGDGGVFNCVDECPRFNAPREAAQEYARERGWVS